MEAVKTWSRQQARTRQNLINAFIYLVIEQGYDYITVTDIANAADCGRWTLYHYFKNKEELAWEAVIHWFEQMDNYILDATKDLSFPEREYLAIRMTLQVAEARSLFFKQLGSILSSEWYLRLKEHLIAYFLKLLSTGRTSLMAGVHPELGARLYVTSMLETIDYWAKKPEKYDLDKMTDEFFIFIYRQTPPKLTRK